MMNASLGKAQLRPRRAYNAFNLNTVFRSPLDFFNVVRKHVQLGRVG